MERAERGMGRWAKLADQHSSEQPGPRGQGKRPYRAPTIMTIGALAQLMLGGFHIRKKSDESSFSF